MQRYTEKAEKMSLPVVPLRGIVAFPSIPISFELSNAAAIASCERADKNDSLILLVSEREMSEETITPDNLYKIGCAAKIKQLVKLPEGNLRVFAEGTCRATVTDYSFNNDVLNSEVIGKTINIEGDGGVKGEALVLEINNLFDEFLKYLPKVSNDLITLIRSIKNPGLLSDFVACNVLVSYTDKQQVLEEFEPLRRAELLSLIMERERNILSTEMKIHKKVRSQIEANQREYYLKEQLKAIKNELGYNDDFEGDEEIDEYCDKIAKANLPEEVQSKLLKEVKKLSKTPYNATESTVIRNYLDVCLEIPWGKVSKERIDVEAARKILDRDHDGLEKVKERILEYIAVKQLNPDLKNQIICLVGPPGTGKTSVAASVAKALKRKYVRVSLGGVRDEADIRGHRKTYVASMPGRIANALKQAGVRNPLILLDEIDKLSHDSHGDPASALLEVLDSEQNKAFRDHFLELPLDLSDCLFIATANTLETIPRPLIDRMEIIELKIYTRHEKLSIAKHHLIPKQMKRHGLDRKLLKITDGAIFEIIDFYTREAGVRNLERELASVCRKAAKLIIEGKETVCKVTENNVKDYLGPRKELPEHISERDEVGIVNGLAYTETGGDLLRVEAVAMPGSGKIELTGSLGDVMKESAHAAVTYIRSHSGELLIDPDFYKTKDIHLHFPEGAIPKDGPSAGVTIVTALASELSGRPVRRDIAMTGEVTLRGNVLAIGGLKEKTMAAYKAGVKTVLIPAANERDLSEIDPVVRDALEFVPCKHVSEVLERALIPKEV
ncbi:MAG: endopeptidase La [Firmicutes bacterium]|nr:endopeptidase La [Bacillota bacterium]